MGPPSVRVVCLLDTTAGRGPYRLLEPAEFSIEVPEFYEVLREEEPLQAGPGGTPKRRIGAVALIHRSPARTVRVTTRIVPQTEQVPAVLEIDLANVTPISEREAMSAAYWGEKTIVFPVLRIAFEHAPGYPSQDDVRRLTTEEAGDARRTFLTEVQERAPRGVNCVVTIPDSSDRTLLAGMTAIHDNVLVRPIPGPPISELADQIGVVAHLDCFSNAEIATLASGGHLATLTGVIETVRRAFPDISHLHRFQWLAIQRQARLLLTGTVSGSCHLVKAPTGTGKTPVFMANSLLYFLWTGQRTVLAFPTRILNEDMYRRLTVLVYHARLVFPQGRVTGGILIGTRDPLYAAVARPEPGQRMVQFEKCPKCQTRESVFAQRIGARTIGICKNPQCEHAIDYMYGSGESSDYLPAILIATPDKLFYEATARSGAEHPGMRLFGAPVKPCGDCGALSPVWWNYASRCIKCNSENLGAETRRPIQFWTFDEVHSLHGLTGIYLSVFLALLQLYQRRSIQPTDPPARQPRPFAFQVGSCNDSQRGRTFDGTDPTRRSRPATSPRLRLIWSSPRISPQMPGRTRYRSLVTMPIGTSSSRLAGRTMLHLRDTILRDSTFQSNLEAQLGYHGAGRPYRINLTYVQRKDVGRLLVREYRDQTARLSGIGDAIPFVSGDTSNEKLVEYFARASSGTLQTFVANVVISLGLDIENLNQLVMVSLPESITEYVQTIGRTGRRENAPGHVHVIVRPDLPRDIEFFGNFQYILSDLRGTSNHGPCAGRITTLPDRSSQMSYGSCCSLIVPMMTAT